MQPVDFTTIKGVCWELQQDWLPARLEQIYQRDRYTLALALRTLQGRGWLTLSWHPQAARLHMGDPPPRLPDTFAFSKQLLSQLKGLALCSIEPITPWERALDLQFAPRPQEPALWHLYVEIMGKHSNVILVNQANQIVTVAHQVGQGQTRIRPIQTGQPFSPPPPLQEAIPRLEESFEGWQEQVSLIPGPIAKMLLKTYRGVSSALARSLVQAAELDPQQPTTSLTETDWQRLFQVWQAWLQALATDSFQPTGTGDGYTVLGQLLSPQETQAYIPLLGGARGGSIQSVLNTYYTGQLNRQQFQQLRHQISQKLQNHLNKIRHKAQGFGQRLDQSRGADRYRLQGDLLMAHLHRWQPGMEEIQLTDFETEEPIAIALNPEKNGVQNAQALYKQHQKLKRARLAVEPLLAAVNQEVAYLEQIETSLGELPTYQESGDLLTLEEIRDELVEQGYLKLPDWRGRKGNPDSGTDFYQYRSPSGFELWVGRNNRQNDQLTFRVANDYDLWFHTQEIPGSHALLRLVPGSVPEDADLQYAANVTAYHSRARHSPQVPVIYTKPRHVYKPKGTPPGMVIYKQEQVIWGQPQAVME
jgi:predicted ribosome quality control (RQC) complex YloA/Tae2 family protein